MLWSQASGWLPDKEQSMRRISVRVDDDLYEQVAVLAEATGRSINQLAVDALTEQLESTTATDEGREQIRAHLRRMAERFGLEGNSDV